LPLALRVQAKECVASHTITSGTPVDMILNRLDDHPGLRLGLGSFTCELDFVEGGKPVTDTLRSMEVVEVVFKLRKPKLLLAVDDTI
jgi:hypothetical protein